MSPAWFITWLYVSGGIGFWALGSDAERASPTYVFVILAWPFLVPLHILIGAVKGIAAGIRGVIGK